MTMTVREHRETTTEFPPDLLTLLRCSKDGGELSIDAGYRRGSVGVIDARLCCNECGAEYLIEDGIARMMLGAKTEEDAHEIAIRDVEYSVKEPAPVIPPESGWRSALSDLIEIPPFLKALQPLEARRVLEFGCGDGRLTMLMAQHGAQVLAVDFSLNALHKMAGTLASGVAPTSFPQNARDLRGRVGLVQADASAFRVQPYSFDRALSATPLDSRDERLAMYRAIAEALVTEGAFIGSLEYDDLLRRVLGLPIARRYEHGGIFIEHFDVETVRREVAPYFLQTRIYPIRPRIPFARRLPQSWAVRLARIASALPVTRQLGEIVLFRAERPVRLPAEGIHRPGNSLIKGLFRWYTRRIGKQPLWDGNELV
jgi:SAM-dependent methyltransferase